MISRYILSYFLSMLSLVAPWSFWEELQKTKDNYLPVSNKKRRLLKKTHNWTSMIVLIWVFWIYGILFIAPSIPRVVHQEYVKVMGSVVSQEKTGKANDEIDSYYDVRVKEEKTGKVVEVSSVVMPKLSKGTKIEINILPSFLRLNALIKINDAYYERYYKNSAEEAIPIRARKIIIIFYLLIEIRIYIKEYKKHKKWKESLLESYAMAYQAEYIGMVCWNGGNLLYFMAIIWALTDAQHCVLIGVILALTALIGRIGYTMQRLGGRYYLTCEEHMFRIHRINNMVDNLTISEIESFEYLEKKKYIKVKLLSGKCLKVYSDKESKFYREMCALKNL